MSEEGTNQYYLYTEVDNNNLQRVFCSRCNDDIFDINEHSGDFRCVSCGRVRLTTLRDEIRYKADVYTREIEKL